MQQFASIVVARVVVIKAALHALGPPLAELRKLGEEVGTDDLQALEQHIKEAMRLLNQIEARHRVSDE